MLDQAADVPQRQLRQSRVTVAREERLAIFPQRLMGVHAAAVVLEERLRHESHRLSGLVGDILHDVLEQHHVVGRADQRVKAQINLRLASTGDLMMVTLDLEPAALHGERHLGTQVLIMVGRRYREITLFVARTIAQVALPPGRNSNVLPRRR